MIFESILTAALVTVVGLAVTALWRIGGLLARLPAILSRLESAITALEERDADLVQRVSRLEGSDR